MDPALSSLLAEARARDGLLVVLTGAGISAESGIPTFRGREGYWTVGSTEYHPQEMATHAAFSRMPREVWAWYLYRRGVCRAADANPAHLALVELERGAGDRFRLLTQNVDGLHLRAGNSAGRTYQIHGNIDFMRCAEECAVALYPVPDEVGSIARGEALSDERFELLRCGACGGPARPHVLWFDECYDEPRFRFQSSLEAAAGAALLVTVGTSATTNLPNQVVRAAVAAGAALLDVNPEENPFSEIADRLERGHAARGPAAAVVPAIVDALLDPVNAPTPP